MKLILQKPFKGNFHLSQRFGAYLKVYADLGMKGHNGHDWALPFDTPIYSAHDGIVIFADYDNSRGLGVEVRTKEKFDFEQGLYLAKTMYWHLRDGGAVVTVGQEVKAGDLLGYSGSTGLSTGNHLHFSLKLIDDNFKTINRTNGYTGAIDQITMYDYGFKYQFMKVLKKGSLGLGVTALQKVCGFFGFFDFNKDAVPVFGQKTSDALARFQTFVIPPETFSKSELDMIASETTQAGKKTRAFINNLLK